MTEELAAIARKALAALPDSEWERSEYGYIYVAEKVDAALEPLRVALGSRPAHEASILELTTAEVIAGRWLAEHPDASRLEAFIAGYEVGLETNW